MKNYPCETCAREKKDGGCFDKKCPAWQAWFLDKWQEINNFYRKYLENKEETKDAK